MNLDNSLLVNQKKLEGIEKDITCPICQGIINDPYFCNKCQNNFCRKCIKKWELNNKKCPFKCKNPEYTSNRFLNKIFSELLKFTSQKSCDEQDTNDHFENCNKEDFKSKYYESQTQVEILKVQFENYNDIKNELNQTQERKEELENELEEIKEEKRDLEYKIEDLEERINDLENELEKEDNCNLRNKINDILKDNEDLTNELKEEKEKNSELESKLESLEKEKINFEKTMRNSEKMLKVQKQLLSRENRALEVKILKLKK